MNNLTAPPGPAISLGLRLEVTTGRNQIQRSVGKYAALYLVPDSRISDAYLELAPGEVYTSNPGESTSNLVVSTSSILNFSGGLTIGGNLNFVVNRLMAIDDSLANYSLTNVGSSVARISINAVNITSLLPVSAIYYGTALAPVAINAAFVESLILSPSTDKNQIVTMNAAANEFLYYCYPLIMGESNFAVNGFIGGMQVVGITTLQTPKGPMQYYVYQSDNAGLGAITLTVTEA